MPLYWLKPDEIGLLGEIRDLLKKTAQAEEGTRAGLAKTVLGLREEIATLKVDKSRIEEEHARKDRDLRHDIGLEKRRQEAEKAHAEKELSLAKKEAVHEANAANLQHDREQFTKEITFIRERMEKENEYVRGMLGEVLKRLPNVTAAFEVKGKK